MALGGWGLTPGTMEANVTRSLGGGYGSVGSSPGTISDMTRNKYTAGLQAKKAKEAIDLTRTAETNRQSEAAQQFGLQTEKFGFEKASTEKDWAYRQKQLALQKAATEGGWSQQELDRALREEQLIQSGSQFDRDLAQSASQFGQNLAEQIRQANMTANNSNASLAERTRASQEAERLKRDQMGLTQGSMTWQQQQAEQARTDEQSRLEYDRKMEQERIDREKKRYWYERRAAEKAAAPTTGGSSYYRGPGDTGNTGVGRM